MERIGLIGSGGQADEAESYLLDANVEFRAISDEYVDKTKKIAELTYYGNNKWLMKWFGFWDAKKKTRFWVKEPDFIQTYAKNSAIAMIKCEEQ